MTNLRESPHAPRNTARTHLKTVDSSPNVAALLLTNVATIASNELNHSVLTKPMLFDPTVMSIPCRVVPGEMTCACLHYDYGRSTPPPPPIVSSDDENHLSFEQDSPMDTSSFSSNAYCQPVMAASCPSVLARKKSSPLSKRRMNHSSSECIVQKPRVVREVLAKKFSWKNYPELEDYLIANRQDYLRHSRLNYSLEQKRFNNKLTEDLLELATDHGYVFDNFSFVMLRDKIRCYYKSYLQTLRKKQQNSR